MDLVHLTILRPPNTSDLTPVRELSLIPFPADELFAADLGKFDLVIFDSYHRRGILPMLYLENVVDYVLAGGAVLDAAGPAFASPLSLASTPLGNVLPARPNGQIHAAPFLPRLTIQSPMICLAMARTRNRSPSGGAGSVISAPICVAAFRSWRASTASPC